MNTRPKSTSDIQVNGDGIDAGSKFKLGRLSYYEYKSCPADSHEQDECLDPTNDQGIFNESSHLEPENNLNKNGGNMHPKVRSVTNIIINNSGNGDNSSVSIYNKNLTLDAEVSKRYQCAHCDSNKPPLDVNGSASSYACSCVNQTRDDASGPTENGGVLLNRGISGDQTSGNNSSDGGSKHSPSDFEFIDATPACTPQDTDQGLANVRLCTSNTDSSGAKFLSQSSSDSEESACSFNAEIQQSSTYQNFDGYLSEEDDSSVGIVNPAVDNTGCETDETAIDEGDDKVASRIDIHKLKKTSIGDRKPHEKRKESFEQRLRRRFTIKDEHTSEVTKRILAVVIKYSLFVFNFCSWVS